MMREAKLATNAAPGGGGGGSSNKSSTKRRRRSTKNCDFIELDTFVISAATKPTSNNNETHLISNTNTSENPKTDSNTNNQTLNTTLASVSLNENVASNKTPTYLNAVNMESGGAICSNIRRVSLNLPIEYTLQDSKQGERSTNTTKRPLLPFHHQHQQHHLLENSMFGSSSKLNGCKKIEIFLLASVVALVLANLHFILFLNINIEEAAVVAAAAAAATNMNHWTTSSFLPVITFQFF